MGTGFWIRSCPTKELNELPHHIANLGAMRCTTRPPSAPLPEAAIVSGGNMRGGQRRICAVPTGQVIVHKLVGTLGFAHPALPHGRSWQSRFQALHEETTSALPTSPSPHPLVKKY